MSLIEEKYNIVGIVFSIKSNAFYKLTNRFNNFKVREGKEDIVLNIFEMKQIQEIRNVECKVKKKDINIFSDNDNIYKVSYKNDQKKEICWCVEYKKNNLYSYNIYVFDSWKENLLDFDPFLLVGLSEILLKFSSIMLHSSFVKYKECGILFTAPSQTGKSTQAMLWEKYYKASVINGDRTIIRKEDEYYAWGSPYAGSSDIYVNEKVKLKAIIVLRQAEYNKIRRLSKKEAYLSLMSETFLNNDNRQDVEDQTNIILDIIENIPIYRLECLPNKEAVDIVYAKLKGE